MPNGTQQNDVAKKATKKVLPRRKQRKKRGLKTTTPEYSRQVESQIAQYADVDEMHNLSAAADWVNNRFLSPRLEPRSTGAVSDH